MAFTVSPTVIDAGTLSPGESFTQNVTFGGVPADASGEGTVQFALGAEQATLTFTISIDGEDVTLGTIAVDPALTGVTINVSGLTNAGATIVVARA